MSCQKNLSEILSPVYLIHTNKTQIRYKRMILSFFVTDGFTTDDVIYQWKLNDSVQFAKSLFLPGGFELSDYIGK